MPYLCPQCGSDAVMSKRAIHLNGTTSTNSLTTGVGVVGMGHAGAGVASQSGISASALALECAPPAPTLVSESALAVGGFILAFIGILTEFDTRGLYAAYGAAAFAVLCYLAGKGSNAKAISANSPKLAQYEKEWRCLTCAHTFVPTAGQ